MRRFPQQNMNSGVRRERDTGAFRRQLIMLFCGLVMAGGFVAAAGQHFVAVRYGYESEKLHAERAQLVREQQELILRLNQATAPASLDQAAREIGMQPARASQINGARRLSGAPTTSTTTAVIPMTIRKSHRPRAHDGVGAH